MGKSIFKVLKEIIKAKNPHFLYVSDKTYSKYKYLIKLAVYFNRNYLSCEIFRKKYKHHKKLVIIGLKWYGKNVKRRTNGYAKEIIKGHGGSVPCIYCKNKVTKKNATADHIVPISKGGNNAKVNLIVCCEDCNGERGDQDFYEYLRTKNEKFKNIRKPFI